MPGPDHGIAGLLSLAGRGALVTGAGTGIGEGIAHLLAEAGATVAVADIDATSAEAVAAAIGASGGEAFAVTCDVTDAEACQAAVTAVAERAGRLDVVVNNAGSYHDSGSILDQSTASWERSVTVNFHSVFHVSKPAAAQLVAQGDGGAIVNIASVDAFLPCLGTSYDAAKAAVVQLTRSLALDLSAHGIRVNGVAPGHVAVETLRKMRSGELPPVWAPGSPTGLMGPLMQQRSANIPLGRPGTPADIARAVLFLSTEASSYVTGQTLVVDGGWMLV